MNNTLLIIAVVVILTLVALLFLLNRRPARTITKRDTEGAGAGPATAVENVAGEFLGVEAKPEFDGPADDLTRIKGLGPKAAAQLQSLGITRYAQLAALSTAEINAVDARMGVFRGRIAKDRWIEQAGYLAAGDTASFQSIFGNLG